MIQIIFWMNIQTQGTADIKTEYAKLRFSIYDISILKQIKLAVKLRDDVVKSPRFGKRID